MIIDFHTHVFPDKIAKPTIDSLKERSNGNPCTDGTVVGLLKAIDRAGIDMAVALPVLTKPTQFDSVTKFVCGINANPEYKKIISFGGIHPECDDIDGKLKLLKDNGIKGVKIHPDYQNSFINIDGYVNILKCAKKYDLIVVTHAGIDDGYPGETVKCPPEMVLEVIQEVKYNKFVLAHYGGHKQWDTVLNVLAGQNVYFDTAFTLHEISEKTFKDILYKHGDDRILFATDCPWREIKSDVEILKSYVLDKETEEKIFYKNAIKLLNL